MATNSSHLQPDLDMYPQSRACQHSPVKDEDWQQLVFTCILLFIEHSPFILMSDARVDQ